MHGRSGEERRNGHAFTRNFSVRENQNVDTAADRIDRCGADACQTRFNCFASPGKRIGNIDLFGVELPVGKVRDGTNTLHLGAGEHGLLHFETDGRVHGHDVQEVRTGTNERHE